jgi:hypothetical protein
MASAKAIACAFSPKWPQTFRGDAPANDGGSNDSGSALFQAAFLPASIDALESPRGCAKYRTLCFKIG